MFFLNKNTSLGIALFLFAGAVVLSFPKLVGLSKRFEIHPTQTDGYLLTSKAENSAPRIRGRALLPPEKPSVLENSVPLLVPNSSEKHIRNGGFGRHSIKGREIYFSTSDGLPPQNRRYEVVWPLWSLPEGILLLPWIAGLGFLIFTLSDLRTRPVVWLHGVIIAATGVFLALCLFSPARSAGLFFDGITAPMLWAALVAAWAVQPRLLAALLTCVLSLLPVGAAAFVYLVEARSHGSFIVAGIVPRSDAWLHFMQAVEIAISGGTDVFFNGRLVYPAFLSSLLAITGVNLAVANFTVAALVMLACGMAARYLAWRAGWFGAAGLCLMVWLYYRNDGCGAVMTENFGLLAGLLALPFLVKGFHTGRVFIFSCGIFILGVGFSARPGALFLLPVLAFAAGYLAWQKRHSLRQSVLGITLAAVCGLAGLFSNALLTSSLLRTPGVAFGNFAYSLHGLLHGTDWEDSYFKYQGDTKRIMQINTERLREDPASLVRGIGRAYRETFGRRFLYRFGGETRLAALGMIGFCIAGMAGWFLRDWKRDAPWLTASFFGILASIPFAPPWDASVRPYAVTIPIQALLASLGWIMAFRFIVIVCSNRDAQASPQNPDSTEPSLFSSACLSGLALALAFSGPFFLRTELPKPAGGHVAFLPGASVIVGEGAKQFSGSVPEATFRRGLSELAASYPDTLKEFAAAPQNFQYGIQSPDLEVALVPLPPPKNSAE